MGNCCGGSGQNYSFISINEVLTYKYEQIDDFSNGFHRKPYVKKENYRLNRLNPLGVNWTEKKHRWRFIYESREQYKCKLTIYSGVTFDQNIIIRRQIISNEYKYNKLIVNPLTGDFMILDQDCLPLYFVINNQSLLICSQLIDQPSLTKVKEFGYSDVIDHCKSRANSELTQPLLTKLVE